jgi:hypothetical protein
MRRGALATIFIFHALLHASIGVWAVADHSILVANTLWSAAIAAYLATGLAILRMPVLRRYWRTLLFAATFASVVLLTLCGSLLALLGIPVDLFLVLIAFDAMHPQIDSDIEFAEKAGTGALPHPALRRLGWTAGGLALVYVAGVAVIRPVYLGWGTTAAERGSPLPGDDPTVESRYRVDHGITINAPADSVWPWLVQLGQDRGGFYSYSRLERMVGDRVSNADRIHPEWQDRRIGDTVRATQADYLGGHFGTFGWRVTDIVPGRALVLENWGSFVLVPVDSATTRLIVRTRGPGTRSATALLLGPLNVFVFEPAHFIMQRGMLRGIRDRAEGRIREAT